MGIFNIFKKNKAEKDMTTGFQFNQHIIDNFIKINLPKEWVPYQSDRFRAKTNDGKLQMSIMNYVKPAENNEKIDKEFFKSLKLELYERFVSEGGYVPYTDLKITDQFITKSFKVDEETQYYFTTAKIINGKVVITEIIVREIGDYNNQMQELLELIYQSIEFV